MRTTSLSRRRFSRGFTLLEITITGGLTVFLAILLSSVWRNIARFTSDAVGRGQLVQEMDMAVASLTRDLGGSWSGAAASSFADGRPDHGRWVGWQHPDDDELWLCFDGGTCPDGAAEWSGATDAVIRYYLDADADANATTKVLVREDKTTIPSTKFIVARNMNAMTVEADGAFVKITLQFKYQQRSGATYFGPEYLRNFTLKARAPQ